MFAARMLLLIELLVFLAVHCESTAGEDLGDDEKHPVISNAHANSGLNIRHLHVLFRHGDRSPIINRIVDEAASKKLWPQGLGQLTDTGILQEFELGRWIRKRYGNFIPLKYNASDYHMRSTDLDRTLMSAQAVSAGLFLNSSSPLTPYQLHWRPIPVHTVPQKEDILLSTADCPCLSVLQKVQMNSEKSLQFEKQHAKLFNLLRNQTGMHVDRNNVWEFYDVLTCMRAHNYTMPPWYTEDLYQEMAEVQRFYWIQKFTSTSVIIRLEFGVFINVLTRHILATVNGSATSPTNKLRLSVQHTMTYSAHDTDVSFLLAALGAYDDQLIPYSAAVVIELLGPKPPAPTSKYRLRLVYKKGYADNEGKYLNFGACALHPADKGCALDKVLVSLAPFTLNPAQFDEECQVKPPGGMLFPFLFTKSYGTFPCTARSKGEKYIVYVAVASVVLLTLCTVVLLVWLSVRCRRRRRYQNGALNFYASYPSYVS